MAKDDGADIKRQMGDKQRRQAEKKEMPPMEDLFAILTDPENLDKPLTQADKDFDPWKEMADALKTYGIPPEMKDKLRGCFDDYGKDKMRRMVDGWAEKNVGRKPEGPAPWDGAESETKE